MDEGNIYIASGTTAMVVTALIQALKGARWAKGISHDTGRLNAIVSAVAAFMTSLGLVLSFDYNADTGDFVAGLTGNAWAIAHAGFHGVVQWAQQHVLYEGAVKPGMLLGQVLRELERANALRSKE